MNRKLVSGSLPGLIFFGKFILLLWCLFCRYCDCETAYRPPWTAPSGRRTGRGCRRIWSPGTTPQPHCSPLRNSLRGYPQLPLQISNQINSSQMSILPSLISCFYPLNWVHLIKDLLGLLAKGDDVILWKQVTAHQLLNPNLHLFVINSTKTVTVDKGFTSFKLDILLGQL